MEDRRKPRGPFRNRFDEHDVRLTEATLWVRVRGIRDLDRDRRVIQVRINTNAGQRRPPVHAHGTIRGRYGRGRRAGGFVRSPAPADVRACGSQGDHARDSSSQRYAPSLHISNVPAAGSARPPTEVLLTPPEYPLQKLFRPAAVVIGTMAPTTGFEEIEATVVMVMLANSSR